MLTKCSYIGIEAEGPNRGMKTLFLADSTTYEEDILSILKSHPDIKHIYFGAGGMRYIPRRQIYCLEKLKGMQITIEVDAPNRLKYVPKLDNVTVVLSFFTEELECLRDRKVRIKIEDERQLFIFDNATIYENSIHDPLYDKDEKVII